LQATVQMSRVVEDCSRSWRRKLAKPVCRQRGWTLVLQVGWWKSTGVSADYCGCDPTGAHL